MGIDSAAARIDFEIRNLPSFRDGIGRDPDGEFIERNEALAVIERNGAIPRCSTCKHWEQVADIGFCGAVQRAQDDGPRRAELTDPSALLTGPDFGCVNHESKETT